MKNLLATVCLFLIGSLTVSVFSPGIHKSLFHEGNDCAHGHSKFPCSGHQDSSSDDVDSESCAVILFGQSTDVSFDRVSILKPALLVEEVYRCGTIGTEKLNDFSKRWARGPPLSV